MESKRSYVIKKIAQILAATLVQTIFTVAIGALIFYSGAKTWNYLSGSSAAESQSYEKQLATLNGVQDSLDNLKKFLDLQKKELEERETLLSKLRYERAELQPLVEADREVIVSILRIQAEQNSRGLWNERAIGFIVGIASSLVASFIWIRIWPPQEKQATSEGPKADRQSN